LWLVEGRGMTVPFHWIKRLNYRTCLLLVSVIINGALRANNSAQFPSKASQNNLSKSIFYCLDFCDALLRVLDTTRIMTCWPREFRVLLGGPTALGDWE
jgi:hypothetical protein